MAFKHGKAAVVMLDTIVLSAYLNSVDLGVDADTADTTLFGAGWKSSVIGTSSAKVGYGGLYDPALTTLPALITSVLPGVLTYCPHGGTVIGDNARLVSALSTTYSESSPVGGVVAISGSFVATGGVGFGQVLHPLGEDTDTTTGASKDDAAATATGWIAQLHVAGVDAGTWTVKLQDSADNGTWADVSGGAFVAVAAGSGQRITSATATAALRRYVRYVATRSGGSASDGINFFLAYARNV